MSGPSGPSGPSESAARGAAATGPAGTGAPAVGERVDVDIDEAGVGWLPAALLAYGVPVLGLLGGACLPEPWAPAGALAGLAGGLLVGRTLAERRLAGDTRPGPGVGRARIARAEHPGSSGETP